MLPIKTILHPTDFSGYSEAAFQLACSLAKDYGARLILVHVEPPEEIMHGTYYAAPPSPPEDVEALKEKLFAMRPSDPNIETEYFFLRGEPAENILYLARENDSDLIVMGTHGRTGLGRVLMGSVAEKVLRRAECPVVTVKKPFVKRVQAAESTAAVASVV